MSEDYIIGGDAEGKKETEAEAPRLHVDEGWKEQARREKEVEARAAETEEAEKKGKTPPGKPKEPLPEPDLSHLIVSYATQALFGLGEAENPVTGKKEVDLEWAKFNIDMLQMLEDKTRGNVTPEEKNLFVQLLYDLRMRYVKAVG